jgi:hypothetical protein
VLSFPLLRNLQLGGLQQGEVISAAVNWQRLPQVQAAGKAGCLLPAVGFMSSVSWQIANWLSIQVMSVASFLQKQCSSITEQLPVCSAVNIGLSRFTHLTSGLQVPAEWRTPAPLPSAGLL